MDLSDEELEHLAAADRRAVDPPVQVEMAMWSKPVSSISRWRPLRASTPLILPGERRHFPSLRGSDPGADRPQGQRTRPKLAHALANCAVLTVQPPSTVSELGEP